MSSCVREKVLRIPLEFSGATIDELEANFQDKFGYGDVGKFQGAPTERCFIDYVLEYEYDACCGEFGKIRELYPSEVEKYTQVFKDVMPNCDMSKVKLVEFCWYNCCEAPDYYATDGENCDPFFEEV